MHQVRPRSLAEPGELQARRALLYTEPLSQPLRRYVAGLRDRRGDVPDFDPAEAGVEARILVLHDSPGARTEGDETASGFVSVDNDDAASESMWQARREAGLRHGVLHWNIVPWHLPPARTSPTAKEVADGAAELAALLPLLGSLHAIVLSGRSAQRSWAKVSARLGDAAALVSTWHASPGAVVVRGRREELVRDLQRAAELAGVPLFP